jgi:hypothetical protein
VPRQSGQKVNALKEHAFGRWIYRAAVPTWTKLTACRKSARFLSAPQREVKAACRAFATRGTFDRRCCISAPKHGVAGTRLQAEFRPKNLPRQ